LVRDNINQKRSKNQALLPKKIMGMLQNKKAPLTSITAAIDQTRKRKKTKKTKRKAIEKELKKDYLE
jgi:hypothetical protein